MTILSLNPKRKRLTKQTYKLINYTCNTTRSTTSKAQLLSKCSTPFTRRLPHRQTSGSSILLPGAKPMLASPPTPSSPPSKENSTRLAMARLLGFTLSRRLNQQSIISRDNSPTSGHRKNLRPVKCHSTASSHWGYRSKIRSPPPT